MLAEMFQTYAVAILLGVIVGLAYKVHDWSS